MLVVNTLTNLHLKVCDWCVFSLKPTTLVFDSSSSHIHKERRHFDPENILCRQLPVFTIAEIDPTPTPTALYRAVYREAGIHFKVNSKFEPVLSPSHFLDMLLL